MTENHRLANQKQTAGSQGAAGSKEEAPETFGQPRGGEAPKPQKKPPPERQRGKNEKKSLKRQDHERGKFPYVTEKAAAINNTTGDNEDG